MSLPVGRMEGSRMAWVGSQAQAPEFSRGKTQWQQNWHHDTPSRVSIKSLSYYSLLLVCRIQPLLLSPKACLALPFGPSLQIASEARRHCVHILAVISTGYNTAISWILPILSSKRPRTAQLWSKTGWTRQSYSVTGVSVCHFVFTLRGLTFVNRYTCRVLSCPMRSCNLGSALQVPV